MIPETNIKAPSHEMLLKDPELDGGAEISPSFDDVLVAVHGIGSQRRSETVRAVANRFATSEAMSPGGLAPQPLGYFFSDPKSAAKVFPLDRIDSNQKLGFTEVFWADVPKRVVKDEDTTEEIKEWGRSIVVRARAAFRAEQKKALQHYQKTLKKAEQLRKNAKGKKSTAAQTKCAAELKSARTQLIGPDFGLAAEVVEEIVDTIQVLENLTWLARQACNVRFELQEILEDYVGDVQIVAEFTPFRMEILARFYKVMEDILAALEKSEKKDVRLHIVAHSEGTVIAFLALLHALSGFEYFAGDKDNPSPSLRKTGNPPRWLKHICGFMTFGSPIDKHLLLWPDLTAGLNLSCGARLFDERKIRWRNYYDFGDPVGFKLETARRFLDLHNDTAFEFCGCKDCRHDIGFARYVLPGKAHNDYWDDPDVFEHFIRNVVINLPVEIPAKVAAGGWAEFYHLFKKACKEMAVRAQDWSARNLFNKLPPINKAPVTKAHIPETKLVARYAGVALPYFLSAALLLTGCYLLCKAVTNFVHPGMDLLQRYVSYRITGTVLVDGAVKGWTLFACSAGFAGLIAGTTIASRLPRLALGMRKRGVMAWMLGAAVYWKAVPRGSREDIGMFLSTTASRILSWLHLKPIAESMLQAFGPARMFLQENKGTILTLLVSVLVVIIGLTTTMQTRRWGLSGINERKQRWFRKGSRPLIITGAVAIAIFVIVRMYHHDQETVMDPSLQSEINKSHSINAEDYSPEDQRKLLTVSPPVWPVAISGTAFLYLWWLAVMIFDLAFVWSRYVRGGIALQRLRDWKGLGMKGGQDEHEKHRELKPAPLPVVA